MASLKLALTSTLTLLLTPALCQDSSPTGPTHANIIANCNAYHTVASGEGCYSIEQLYGIAHAQFIEWNPDVSEDCLTNFWGSYAYCVGVGDVETTPAPTDAEDTTTPEETPTPTPTDEETTPISTPPSSTFNETYTINVPIHTWNISTPTFDTNWPPASTPVGQHAACIAWHVAVSGNCQAIISKYGGLNMDLLYAWNPSISEDCSGLYIGQPICIAIQPQSSITFDWPTEGTSISLPDTSEYVAPTTTSVRLVFTPEPTQDGLLKGCASFYKTLEGETCDEILSEYIAISMDELVAWNPAVDADCSGILPEHYYCVNGLDSTDTEGLQTLTVQPASAPTDTIDTCTSWYNTGNVSMSCNDIAIAFGRFTVDEFTLWNPSVWDDCSQILDLAWYCVSVPDTPVTRTMDIPLFEASPTQDGIPASCQSFGYAMLGQDCNELAWTYDISLTSLIALNPAFGSAPDCPGLEPDYFICVRNATNPGDPYSTPTDTPTTTPTDDPTDDTTTPMPTPTGPPLSPDGSCGGTDGYTCLDSSFGDCCSEYNFCGDTTAHCTTNCQPDFGTCTPSTGAPVSPDGSCGTSSSEGYTCLSSTFGDCCSEYGFCGGEAAYCGAGCQEEFGTCDIDMGPAVSTDGACGETGGGTTCLGSEFGDCCSEYGYCGTDAVYCSTGCQSAFGSCN